MDHESSIRGASGGGRPTLARVLGGARFASCLGLLALVAISPFFTGAQSQLAWSVMGVATLLIAAVLFATTIRRARRLPEPPLVIALGLLGLLLVMQLVPLPASVVETLSPRRAELALEAEAALGREPPGAVALTLSTKTTRDALCLLAVYVSAFLASGMLFRGRSRARALFMTLAVSGAALALWGVWRVVNSGLPLTSTYTNRNRLAALLVMELFAAVGWVMLTLGRAGGRARSIHRWGALACSGVIALGIVMTLSRLGLASVAVSLILLAFLALKGGAPAVSVPHVYDRRGARPAHQRALLVTGASVTASVILASLLTSLDPVLARYSLLFEQGTARLTCWRQAYGLVRDFPLTGTGAGSFRHVFPLYQRAGTLRGFWKYAHSDLVNTLTDLGPVGLALVLAAAFFWYRSAWRCLRTASVFRRTVAWIGLGAVTAALVHSLADFVLKQPANALVFSVLCGTAAGNVRSRPERRLPRLVRPALVAGALVFAGLMVPIARAGYWKARAESTQRADALRNALRHDPRDGEARLAAAQALAGASRGGAEEVIALLREAPPGETIDARAAYLAGAMSWQVGDTARADVAMRAAAEFAAAYDDVTFRVGVYFLRRWIETRGTEPGALDLSVEYFRRACLVSPRRLREAFGLLSSAPAGAARVSEIVPPDAASRLHAARYLRRTGRSREAREVLEAAVEEARGTDRARLFGLLSGLRDETADPAGALEARLAHVMETPVESRAAAASAHVDRLLRKRRAADAKLFVGALRRRFPAEPAGLYAEARYAERGADHLLAYRALLEYIEHSVDAEGYHRLADAARRLGRLAEAEKYAGRAIGLKPRQTRYLLARAVIREAAGETELAALDLRAALEVNPANARARRRLMSLYLKAGRPLRAVEVWKEAVARHPQDASAHVGLARAYHAAGLYEEAVHHAKRAATLDPKRTEARDLLRSMPDEAR